MTEERRTAEVLARPGVREAVRALLARHPGTQVVMVVDTRVEYFRRTAELVPDAPTPAGQPHLRVLGLADARKFGEAWFRAGGGDDYFRVLDAARVLGHLMLVVSGTPGSEDGICFDAMTNGGEVVPDAFRLAALEAMQCKDGRVRSLVNRSAPQIREAMRSVGWGERWLVICDLRGDLADVWSEVAGLTEAQAAEHMRVAAEEHTEPLLIFAPTPARAEHALTLLSEAARAEVGAFVEGCRLKGTQALFVSGEWGGVTYISLPREFFSMEHN
jgi:hypothetical protein